MITVHVTSKLSRIRAKSPQLKQRTVEFVSNELLKKCDPYVPFDTGMLRDSGVSHSVPKQGRLVWKTPYANQQWRYGKSKGLRGKKWALRAWADNKKMILKSARKIANGKA